MIDSNVSKQDRREGAGKLYIQVASQFRRYIREGIWRPGKRLPSLESLASEHNVSIVTLRQAVILLGDEGLLRRVHGKGTFVTDTAGVREWLRLPTTWDGILSFFRSAEGKLSNKTLSSAKNASLPTNMQIATECGRAEAYRYMRRVHILDGLPYATSDVYLDENVFEMRPDAFMEGHALAIIDSMDPPIAAKSFQTILITNADAAIASGINVQIGSTVAEVHRSVIAPSDCLVYYSVMYYRGDLIQIQSQLK